mmetsp:Transcript_7864/g.11848  ORF Transcript_7864/g.11848 Transcript_7864/m.11848 type:complete len:115 (-) Transcript_7864:592-936(-)
MAFGNVSSDISPYEVTLAFCLSFLTMVLIFIIFTLVGFNICGGAGCCYTTSNSCCTGQALCLRFLMGEHRLPNLDNDGENSGYLETATEISSAMGDDRVLHDHDIDIDIEQATL